MCVFDKYRAWNNALVGYYFARNESSSVILNVDDRILEEIGRMYNIQLNEGISFKEDFYRTVLIPLEQQREFLQSYILNIRNYDRRNCRITWRSDDVFRFGALLAEHPSDDFTCPALSYAIFSILAFQGNRRNQWKNVKSVMSSYLDNGKFSPEYLIQIFQSIERVFPQFNSGRLRGCLPYVGRIRYHLVLSATERRNFGCQLVRWGIRWDNSSDEGYAHFVQSKIIPRLSRNDSIRAILLNSDNTPYFISFLEHFNPSDFSIDNNRDESVNAYYFLYFRYEQGSQVYCGTPTYVTNAQQNEIVYIPKQNDCDFGLYPVTLRDNGSFTWAAFIVDFYHLRSQEFIFSSYSLIKNKNQYYLFVFKESCGTIWLVQTDLPEEGKPSLIVTRSSADTTSLDLGQIIVGSYLGDDINNPFTDWFDDWNVFHVQAWQLSREQSRDRQKLIKNQEFKLSGGIRHTHSNNFFPIAPPHIFSENNITSTQYHLRLTKRELVINGQPANSIEPNTTVKSDHHIVFNKNFVSQNSVEYVTEIKPVGAVDYTDLGSFIIEPEREEHVNHEPFRYDGWGRPSDADEQYFSENAWHGAWINNNFPEHSVFDYGHRESVGTFKLVELLTLYSAECEYIKQEQLNKIINEVALVEGYGTLDKETVKEIRYALMDLGYMNRSFLDNQSIYQMNPAALVYTNKTAGHRGLRIYLVYGSYTSSQLNNIRTNNQSVRYKNPYSADVLERKPYLKLLPDYILYLTSDIGRCPLDLHIINQPYAYDILSNAGSMCNFERDFPFVVMEREQGDVAQGENYPRLTKYADNYCIETQDGYITHYEREGRRYPIPHNLMKLYVRNCHNRPAFIINGHEIYKTKDMGIPFLLKKAFCEINWELPKEVYAFGLYGCLGVDPLYCKIKRLCKVDDDILNVISNKLSGGGNVEHVSLVDHDSHYALNLYIIKTEETEPARYELRLFNNNKLLAFTKYVAGDRRFKVYVNRSYYYSIGNDDSFTALSPASGHDNTNYVLSELMDTRRAASIRANSDRWICDDVSPQPMDIQNMKVYPVKIMRRQYNN